MKIIHKEILIDVGNFTISKDWQRIEDHIISSIKLL